MSTIAEFESNYSQVRPAHTYNRTTPNVLNAHGPHRDTLRWLYRTFAEPTVEAPSEGYLYLERGYLFDGKHILDENEAWVPATTSDWNCTQEVDAYARSLLVQGAVTSIAASDPDAVLVHFAQVNIGNYGHFLCENAPKLMNIAHSGLRTICILYPEEAAYSADFIIEILAAVGVRAEVKVLAPGSLVRFHAMLHFTPVAKHNFRKSRALLEFRDVAVGLFGADGQDRALFVTRPENGRRRVTNQSTVSAYLQAHSYIPIDTGHLGLVEQVRLFAGARRIIGSVGAGLTNMIFAPAGTEVVYLCNGIIDLFFWDIAGLCDHRFTWFFAGRPRPWTQDDFVADYTVPLGILESSLSDMALTDV
jgi:hypothetical protein